MAVELPRPSSPQAAKLSFTRKVYPSYRYTLALNRSPGLIGAAALAAAGRQRRGDQDRGRRRRRRPGQPLLQSRRVQLSGRVPEGRHEVDDAEGDRRALLRRRRRRRGSRSRSIPSRPSTARTSRESPPGTPARPRRRRRPSATAGLSGRRARAQIGNYRVFNVPTPIGHVANTPRSSPPSSRPSGRHGRDQLLRRRPADRPAQRRARRGGPQRRRGRRRPGHLGRQRPRRVRLGSAGSPGTAPDAISVAALSNSHVFGPALAVTAADAPDALADPVRGAAGPAAPAAWANADQHLVDVGTIVGTDGEPVDRLLCGRRATSTAAAAAPRRLAERLDRLVSRGVCTFALKAPREGRRGDRRS